MIYLIIYWGLLILFIIFNIISALSKNKGLNEFISKHGALLFIVILTPILLIGIITKDPISFGTYQIPTEIQWLGSLFASFFGAWQFYLKPLKERVIKTETEVSSMKSDIGSIKHDTNLIKDKIINECKIVKK